MRCTIFIKFFLSALSIYSCSEILTPKSVTKQIDVVIRKFLWQGGKQNKKKFHLVHWNVFQLPKVYGGLAVKDTHLMNMALGG